MKSGPTLLAVGALLLGAAPALAQGHQHPPAPAAAEAQQQPHAMMCTMGMLPHGNMGGGMPMQHGQAQGEKPKGEMQQPGQMQHGQMQHGQMQHGQAQAQPARPMQHGAMAGGMKHPVTPMMLIHHATELGLTQDQVGRITTLATASIADCQTHMKAATDSHESAFALLGTPDTAPDLAAYEARLREATTHILQAHMGVVRAGQEARALLTPEQLQKLAQRAAQGGSGH